MSSAKTSCAAVFTGFCRSIQEKSAISATKAVFARHRLMGFYSAPMRIQTNRRVFLKGLAAGVVTRPSLMARPNVIGEIDSYFSPPKEWRGKFGEFRSPLIFNDGERVKTAIQRSGEGRSLGCGTTHAKQTGKGKDQSSFHALIETDAEN